MMVALRLEIAEEQLNQVNMEKALGKLENRSEAQAEDKKRKALLSAEDKAFFGCETVELAIDSSILALCPSYVIAE